MSVGKGFCIKDGRWVIVTIEQLRCHGAKASVRGGIELSVHLGSHPANCIWLGKYRREKCLVCLAIVQKLFGGHPRVNWNQRVAIRVWIRELTRKERGKPK